MELSQLTETRTALVINRTGAATSMTAPTPCRAGVMLGPRANALVRELPRCTAGIHRPSGWHGEVVSLYPRARPLPSFISMTVVVVSVRVGSVVTGSATVGGGAVVVVVSGAGAVVVAGAGAGAAASPETVTEDSS